MCNRYLELFGVRYDFAPLLPPQLSAVIPINCMMKPMRWVYGAALFITTALSVAQAASPRKDINPALLYLHAFTLFPDLNEDDSRLQKGAFERIESRSAAGVTAECGAVSG